MLIAYVDESGDTGSRSDPKKGSQYFSRTAVIIDEEHWFEVNKGIKTFRRQHGIPDRLEFHATEIVRGQIQKSIRERGKNRKKMIRSPWGRSFKTRKERINLIENYLNETVVKFDLPIISVHIEKRSIDPHQYNPKKQDHWIKNRSLTFLTERCNQFSVKMKKRIILLFDSVNEKDNLSQRNFQRFLYKQSENISNRNFIETICFAPSGSSEFLQLADVCSYANGRYLETSDSTLYDVIKNNIKIEKFWPE